jgi:hypothetical protein
VIHKKIYDDGLKILYIHFALNWCKMNMGINPRKRKKLLLDISNEKMVKNNNVYYGDYRFQNNLITIYIKNCKTFHDIISTTIHEYTHYLQSGKKYVEYSKKYYYSQNPCERQAKRNEKRYTKICFSEIKNLINH